MASSYLWTGTHMMATHKLRSDTYHPDPDIVKDARVLAERISYEERTHTGLPGRDDDTVWLEYN